jgi:hypothetical protein
LTKKDKMIFIKHLKSLKEEQVPHDQLIILIRTAVKVFGGKNNMTELYSELLGIIGMEEPLKTWSKTYKPVLRKTMACMYG